MSIDAKVKALLSSNFPSGLIETINDTHIHHDKPYDHGELKEHHTIILISSLFEDVEYIDRQRSVLTILKKEFDDKELHMFSIKVYTPAEWKERQS